jgi:hypothetical protein
MNYSALLYHVFIAHQRINKARSSCEVLFITTARMLGTVLCIPTTKHKLAQMKRRLREQPAAVGVIGHWLIAMYVYAL